ncbi:hypothetical protein [Dietzia maris]|uniref:hypothetical protein n=1 Tax=Dietzia maris TaxID=37915 RepID=UPI00223BA8AC|nr:hypothetical protein [Dietzia maris]MCT1433797.1 hypothetical protein [Dietzia maris]MCT1520453.1 hypothetical protein [Dietzia maris]
MSPSVVLVPGAPVLVPELSGSAVAETEGGVATICEMLRRAGRGAARVVVLGTDHAGRSLGDMRSSLSRWGVDVPVGPPGAPPAPHAAVPDPALIAWWLLDLAGIDLPRRFVGVTGGPQPVPTPVSDDLVVVVADGPASLTPRAPVPEDPRGIALDGRLARWLRASGGLPDPGERVADEIGWWSRPSWLVLAELVADRTAVEALSWAPFGVGYHGAWWPPKAAAHATVVVDAPAATPGEPGAPS